MGRPTEEVERFYGSKVSDLLGYITRGQCYEADGLTLKPGMKDTPARLLAAWHDELCSGYDMTEDKIAEMLTQFDSEKYDEMVIQRGIEFNSSCEHHVMEFRGTAYVGYIPEVNGHVVGLSKLARLVDAYSHRLQMQERITLQITTALMTHLKPVGAACVLVAKHSCVSCRGVGKQNAEMVTSSMQGRFRDDLNTKSEFLRLCGL